MTLSSKGMEDRVLSNVSWCLPIPLHTWTPNTLPLDQMDVVFNKCLEISSATNRHCTEANTITVVKKWEISEADCALHQRQLHLFLLEELAKYCEMCFSDSHTYVSTIFKSLVKKNTVTAQSKCRRHVHDKYCSACFTVPC